VARILTIHLNGKVGKRRFLRSLLEPFQYFRYLDRFTRATIIILLLLAFTTPVIIKNYQIFNLGAAPDGNQVTENKFVESFTWQGDHGAIIAGGTSNTVWWNAHNWDTRGDTAYNAFDGGPKGGQGGDHIDIHTSSADLTDGKRLNNKYVIGGDGGPGVGTMHLDMETISSARLRNPMLISAGSPGIVEFRAPTSLTSGHWWEVAIAPANKPVSGAEFTAAPSTSDDIDGQQGPGHRPAEDSINFIVFGRDDVPCTSGWGINTGITKSLGGSTTDSLGPIITTGADPTTSADKLFAWRLEYYPDKMKLFADLNEDGTRELLHTFNVSVPWSEVYVYLMGAAYQAYHHPQGLGDCHNLGQIRELPWKEVLILPVKYPKTRAYPKEQGTDRIQKNTGWMGFDMRDSQRFGVVNGIEQPNGASYDEWKSAAFCSMNTWFCDNPVSTKTLTFNIPAEDASGITHAQFIYDIRYDGTVTLEVNGKTVPGSLLTQSSVPGHGSNGEKHWVQRSKEVDPSFFQAGTNTLVVKMSGSVMMDRLQFEFGYGQAAVVTGVPTPTPTSKLTPTPTAPAPTSPPGKIACSVSTSDQPKAVPGMCNLNKGEAAQVTLKDGSKRTVTLVNVEKVITENINADQGPCSFTFLAKATVNVDGELREMGVSMDQPYTVVKGVRMYAMRSKIFNSDSCWSASWNHDLTLMLTDASPAPFSTSGYHYPLEQLWGLNEHAGREAYSGRHHDGYDIGSPNQVSPPAKLFAHIDGKIWSFGPVYGGAEATNNRIDLAPANNQWADSGASYFHAASLAPGVSVGSLVTKGQWIGNAGLIDSQGYPHLHWVGGEGLLINEFPFLKESYNTTMTSKSKYQGYPKDWLVIGPFSDANTNRLLNDHLAGEETTIQPSEATVTNGKTWKGYDNLLSGAVDFASALSPAPYSGYAGKVKDNYKNSIGYAHLYINSPVGQSAALWLGYNDGLRAWLNGSLVHSDNANYLYDSKTGNDMVPDQAKININLNPGWNRLLLKISQDSNDIVNGGHWNTPHSWKFSARVVDASGNPVNNLTYSLSPGGVVPTPTPTPISTPTPTPIFTPLTPTPAAPITGGLPWLKTSGNKIQTASGQNVVLRGANIMRSEWVGNMDFEKKAFPVLNHDWKGNVMLRGFASDPVNSNNSTYLGFLDGEQKLAEGNNMYIVFVWRSYEINGDQPTMPNDSAQQALVKLATRYKGKSNVMYGLQVEPHDVSWGTLLPRFNSMVTAIRQASSPNKPIIMIPGTEWGRDVHWAITQPVTADAAINIVYKSHPYDSSSEFQQQFINTYNANLPVFIGEFGTGSFMNQSDVDALLTITRERNISWAAWLFDSEGCPCLLTDRTTFNPTNPYGVSIKNEMLAASPIPKPSPTPTPTPTLTPNPTKIPTQSPTNTPVPITLSPQRPIPIACIISSSSWKAQSVTEGTTVELAVSTNSVPSCIGKQISFRVKKDNGLMPAEDVDRNPLPVSITGGHATSTWVAEFHANGLFGLFGSPRYFFEAKILGESGTLKSSPPNLEVNKVDSLVILGSPTITTTDSSATIRWETNRNSSSRVSYGLRRLHRKTTPQTNLSPGVTSHSVTIPNLKSCTIYHYRVASRENAGVDVRSPDATFVTKGCNASVIGTKTNDTIRDILSGGSLDLLDDFSNGLSLFIPPSFLSNNANFQILRLNKDDFARNISLPEGLTGLNHVYHINALLEDENTILSAFDTNLSVKIKYSPSEIEGTDEDTLTIYKWNGKEWISLTDCILNKQDKFVTCSTSALSDFVLVGKPTEPTLGPTTKPTSVTPSYGTPAYGTPSYGTPSYGTPSTGGNRADLNSDGKVNVFDLSILLRNWNKSGQDDLNNDGKVNIFDLSILLRSWSR